MVLIPSVSFLVLWAIMTATGTFQAGTLMLSVVNGRDSVAVFDSIAAELREERRLTQLYLGDPDAEGVRGELEEQRESTDDSLGTARERASTLRSSDDDEVRSKARAFLENGGKLDGLRAEVGEGETDRDSSLFGYTTLIEDITLLTSSLLRGLDHGASLSESVLARELLGAREEYSRAEALLAGAIAADGLSYQETAHFTYLTASYRGTLTEARQDMSGEIRRQYEDMIGSGNWAKTEQLSRSVVTRSPIRQPEEPGDAATWNSEIPVSGSEWEEAAQGATPAFDDLVSAQAELATDTAWDAALWRIAAGFAGCAVTLVAGIVAIVIATRSSRRLIGRLSRLRSEALNLTETRLPGIVARAQSGRRVDVAEELPALSFGADEIGQVADAFNTAQRTAVGAAVKQAEIRKGVNRVFLGIAYRNQTLVQCQLRLLDEIEDNEGDLDKLQKLFRLDHLATRARRYADNLIILGGASSARRWRRPLPLVDVLRAAVSETEDYERVRLTSAPRVWLRGLAVADVVHLIAELVENAAQFSPAGSQVDLNCGPVAGGIAVDVEDRGIGMTEEGYASAARTLAEAPEFDVMALPDEPRLGLFVVARLAARHGVKVRLFPSPYGGTRATVVLPQELLEPVSTDDGDVTEEMMVLPGQRPAAVPRSPGGGTGDG
ncbi:sensor histidine kinase [Allosalinactinospora lopnorensis]|uniref:sensor histidine kinase n=1 Tax=Allosalinactinospora lopnorensis TaxID=1352348 RepID=UPI000695FB59|nr:nitrate- and nitrite sensing domain-containing protein [Allosalinactinospora lopnorensis]